MTFPVTVSKRSVQTRTKFLSFHFHLIDISRFGISIIKWKLNVSFLIALIFSVVKLKMFFFTKKNIKKRPFEEMANYLLIIFLNPVGWLLVSGWCFEICFVYFCVNNSSLYLSDQDNKSLYNDILQQNGKNGKN